MKKGIQNIYKEVAPTYALVNHVLTFGLDVIWRKKAARKAAKLQAKHVLDVCSGNGELANQIAAYTSGKVEIQVVDGSFAMIKLAKNKKHLRRVKFYLADAAHLPFPANSFDLVTISFSSRNLNPNPQAMLYYLKEFLRVIKPGGYFLNLETSQPPIKIIRKLYHLYIRLIVKTIGSQISGSKAGYNYLASTMPRFYDAKEFTEICYKAGFSNVNHCQLFLGVAAIHLARK